MVSWTYSAYSSTLLAKRILPSLNILWTLLCLRYAVMIKKLSLITCSNVFVSEGHYTSMRDK